MSTVAFFHAHPDDEAIFTGGTMARLADSGNRVVLIVATNGELGVPHEDDAPPDQLAAARRAETEAASRLLGVSQVYFLGYHDSGMAGDPANDAAGSLWGEDASLISEEVARLLGRESAEALVTYDSSGIYGHPDHLQVHRAGRLAAARGAVGTLYESTIDREYLHFVETHLVEEAILGGDLGMARSHLGSPSVEITTTIDVSAQLERKRAAMAAHRSQIPETAAAFQLGMEQFSAVYGWEWFIRYGPPGSLDELAV
jgi:LmbE family N-acetylglucosaminyl deacetylase